MAESGTSSSVIQSPWGLRLRRWQHHVLPFVVVAICALLAAALWSRHQRGAVGTGEVNAVQVLVESKVPGMLRDLPRPVAMFDQVKAGDTVARVDMSIEEAELNRLQQEFAAIEGKTPATTLPANGATAWYHARIDELQVKLRAQEIKAPIAGTIIRIHRRPGESAVVGKEIMTIAANTGDFIVGYFRQDQGARPTPGQYVQIRGRGRPVQSYRAAVVSVSPQVELLPARHRRNPLLEEWGFVAQIAIPKSAQLKPGEMLDLALEPKSE